MHKHTLKRTVWCVTVAQSLTLPEFYPTHVNKV